MKIDQSKLKNLSQEELADLAQALLNSNKSAQSNQVESYQDTAHKGQLDFHKATNRIRLFLGGNRSGKTTGGTMELFWRLSGKHPYQKVRTPIKAVLLAQDFQNHAQDVLIPKFNEWFPEGFFTRIVKNQSGIPVKFYCKNGSTLDIRSQDQDLRIFESSDYDYLWCDEPPPYQIFKAIWRGLTDRGGLAVITGTPIVEPWIHDLYMKAMAEDNKGMHWAKFVSTYDNATNLGEGDEELGKKRIQEFASLFDKDELEARIGGRFLHMQGLVFKTWSRKVHGIAAFAWPVTWPIWISIDPHPRKPWGVSFIGFTPTGNVILIRSAYAEGVVEDVADLIFEMREEIEMEGESKPSIRKVYIDNYASVDSMVKRTTIIKELTDYLQPVLPKVETAPKNVAQKIEIFKTWLKVEETKYGLSAKFLVFEDFNKDFIQEIEHYVWAKFKGRGKQGFKNAPEKDNDDILDTVMQIALIVGKAKISGNTTAKRIKYAGGNKRGR